MQHELTFHVPKDKRWGTLPSSLGSYQSAIDLLTKKLYECKKVDTNGDSPFGDFHFL